MNNIKGFVTIDAYINNTPGVTSPIGELSTWSRTYSKEKGEYQDTNVSGYKLVTFKAEDNTTHNPVALLPAQVTEILLAIQVCVNYATTHIRPYDPTDFKNTLLAAFYQTASNLQFGNFVDNGTIALPEWISYTSIKNDNSYVKVWLSDAAFQNQYDEYSIEVIEPLDNPDDLFGLYSVATATLATRNVSYLGDAIQAAKIDNPETYLRILSFDYINILDTTQKTPTSWAVLIYGKVGDNVDAIKDAITQKVLAASKHSTPEWEAILPDLFKRTEFTLLPRWDKIAVPNLTTLASLYSALSDPAECISFATNVLTQFTPAFVSANLTVFPYNYKELMVLAVSGDTNVTGSQKLQELFPDYMPLATTSTDFNRMQLNTKNWILFLENLLIAAETADNYSSIPVNLRKQVKYGVLYISGVFENVNYLVAARSNAFYA